MKNAMLALLLCMGATACLDQSAPSDDPAVTADEATASQSQADTQVTGHELDPTPPGGAKTASCYIGSGACYADGGYTYHTCNFQCCSGEVRSVQALCGDCLGRANSWCGSGTYQAWWTP